MIDTHTHIYEKAYDEDRDLVVRSAVEAGVGVMLLPSTSEEDVEDVWAVTEKYKGVCMPMYGLHPTEIGDNPDLQLDKILDFAMRHEPYVGIGEIGLDLHWDKSNIEVQKHIFERQIDYAWEHDKPVSIHCREAVSVLMNMFEKRGGRIPGGSLHCYDGSVEQAKVIVRKYPQLGFGFGGSCTYKNSKVSEVAANIPLTHILTETDAPYLTPVPHRGTRNEPKYVPLVVSRLAAAIGVSEGDLGAVTEANARRIFGLKE